MKKLKRWSTLAYAAEIIMLIIALILVIRFIPDFGKKPIVLESSSETEESSSEYESGGTEEDENAEQPSKPDDTGQTKESGGDGSGTSSKGAYKGGSKKTEPSAGTEPAEPVYAPPAMIVASDLHYMSPAMTDFGEALESYTEFDDGKVVPYLDQVTDAFLEEVVKKKPSVLILSGDLSQNGEKVNHGELARKLRRVQKQGIPVLVIPGNHDINHPDASTFYGTERVATETVDADGFYDIYHEFGYDQAADRDEASLSYLYKLDERYWLMMLDSCQYYPVNEVGGRIRRGTLLWMEEWLERAKEEHVTVIPVAHHNLLNESVLYPDECTLENSREVVSLLERYDLPVYISGHLHLQRVKKNVNGPTSEGQYGIHEIVSNALSIPPCQYGVINWAEDGSLNYETRTVDVAAWAKNSGSDDENLLNFASYSSDFLVDIVSGQTYRSIESIPKDRKRDMAELYGRLNSAYCKGTKIDRTKIKAGKTYFYWERYLGASKWFDRLTAILKDTGNDHNSLNLKAGVDFSAVDYEAQKEQNKEE